MKSKEIPGKEIARSPSGFHVPLKAPHPKITAAFPERGQKAPFSSRKRA